MSRGPRDTKRHLSRRELLLRGGACVGSLATASLAPVDAFGQMFSNQFWKSRHWDRPVNDVWTTMSTASAPSARGNHVAFWTGTKMIVWGGQNGGSYYNTGGVYDLAGNSWTSTTTSGAPGGRNGHNGVWTGSVMIVWGGFSGSVLNTGGRYDPSTNTWASTTTTGAPTARTNFAATWTGTEMLIWGGQNGSGSTVYNTGGRYNPTTNTWTAMSTVGAPSARSNVRAEWTGSKMIVWGGDGTSASLNDGGMYDPVTDTWSLIPSTGAPTARSQCWFAWTGDRLVVWGGSGSGSYFSSGGIYDPETNSWMTSTQNGLALSTRANGQTSMPSTWTGNSLFVWGGFNGSRLGDGGLFNPAVNNWKTITSTNAPPAKNSYSTVWTGSKVIVWGGSTSGGDTNTGSIYG